MFVKYGTQKTVSSIYYLHKDTYKWIFTTIFFVVGSLNFYHGNIGFVLGGAALAFVGAAAKYKEKITNTVHYIGAWGSITLSLAGVALTGNYMHAVASLLIIGAVYFTTKQNRTTWVEIAAFISIMLGVQAGN